MTSVILHHYVFVGEGNFNIWTTKTRIGLLPTILVEKGFRRIFMHTVWNWHQWYTCNSYRFSNIKISQKTPGNKGMCHLIAGFKRYMKTKCSSVKSPPPPPPPPSQTLLKMARQDVTLQPFYVTNIAFVNLTKSHWIKMRRIPTDLEFAQTTNHFGAWLFPIRRGVQGTGAAWHISRLQGQGYHTIGGSCKDPNPPVTRFEFHKQNCDHCSGIHPFQP